MFIRNAHFNEIKFIESDNEGIKRLIDSTQILIDNIEYRDIIDKHVSKQALQELIIDLILKYRELQEQNQKNYG